MTCNIIYFPESVPVTTTPKVLLPAAPVALPKYNFNSEACSGCFLKKSPPKTEIRTLSQPLAPVQPGKPDGSSDIGLNVQLPFRESIAQTVASRLGLLQDTLQTSNTNTNAPNTKTIELGLNLAMSTYYTTKNAVTGHVSTQTSNSQTPSANTKIDYNVGVVEKASPPVYRPLNIRLNEDVMRQAITYGNTIPGHVPLPNQPLVETSLLPASQVKIFALDGNAKVPLASNIQSVAQHPNAGLKNINRSGVSSAKTLANTKTRPPHTFNPHQTPFLSKLSRGLIINLLINFSIKCHYKMHCLLNKLKPSSGTILH